MSDVSPDSATRLIAHVAEGISVDVGSGDAANAVRAAEMIRCEISRLEQMFSVGNDASMLNRWIADPSTNTTDEFDRLLAAGIEWQRVSRGAFNVSMRRLRDLWDRAAAAGCQPSPGELHEVVEDIADAPYRFEADALRQLRDCSVIDLDAIVLGFAIDIAVDKAMRALGLGAVTVSTCNRTLHRCGRRHPRVRHSVRHVLRWLGSVSAERRTHSPRPHLRLEVGAERRRSRPADGKARVEHHLGRRHRSRRRHRRCRCGSGSSHVDSRWAGLRSPIEPARNGAAPERVHRRNHAAADPMSDSRFAPLRSRLRHLNGPAIVRVRVEDADAAGPESRDPGAPHGHDELS